MLDSASRALYLCTLLYSRVAFLGSETKLNDRSIVLLSPLFLYHFYYMTFLNNVVYSNMYFGVQK